MRSWFGFFFSVSWRHCACLPRLSLTVLWITQSSDSSAELHAWCLPCRNWTLPRKIWGYFLFFFFLLSVSTILTTSCQWRLQGVDSPGERLDSCPGEQQSQQAPGRWWEWVVPPAKKSFKHSLADPMVISVSPTRTAGHKHSSGTHF